MRRLSQLCLALCGLIICKSSNASELEDMRYMSMDELLNMQITVASRSEMPFWKSPSSVTLFSRADIRNLGVRTLFELLSYVPGFYSMMNSVEGNQSHMIMRGHAQKYANTLLVLLNGQRVNDDYTGGINYLFRYFNIHNASKIEVIRGPGSALYGSNAYNGVVNIITDPTDEVAVELGSLGIVDFYWSNSTGVNDWKLGATIDFYRDNGDDFDDVFDRFGLQTTTQDPKEVQQISLFAGDGITNIHLQYLKSMRQDYYLFRRLRDGVTEIELDHWMLYGNHQLINNDRWKLGFSAGYQFAARKSVTALAPGGSPPFEPADFLFGEDIEYQSKNLAIDGFYQYTAGVSFNFGMAFYLSQVPDAYLRSNYDLFGDLSFLGNLVTFDNSDERVVLDKKRHINSGYLQAQWDFSQNLSVTAGLRFDAYNDVDNALTPRLAFVYQLGENRGFKLIYGEAYRAPSLGDLYDEESGLVLGNASLEASEITSIEAVYFTTLGNHSLTGTWFSNEQTNLIGFRTDGDSVFLDNVAGNDAAGFELEWLWQPSTSIQIRAAYTHLNKNKTDLGISEGLPASEDITPHNYMNYSAGYVVEDWSFNLSGSWRDQVNVLASDDDLLLVNSLIRYNWSKQLDLSLNIKNLLNKSYQTSSYIVLGNDANGPVQQYPARGRELTLQLSYAL